MIEQQNNLLLIFFPTPEAAASFKAYLEIAILPWLPANQPPVPVTSEPPSDQSPAKSRHTVLTDERLEALSNQRLNGMSSRQRLLRAQNTLRDGVLPFSKPGQPPQPTNQPSPRMRAQAEGGFADGLPQAAALRLAGPADGAVPPEAERKRSRLRPAEPKDSSSR